MAPFMGKNTRGRGGGSRGRGRGGRGGSGGGRGGYRTHGRKPDDTATLPSFLLEQLQAGSSNNNDAELDKRFEFRFNKKKLSRKDERKNKRLERKQKVAAHYSQKKIANTPISAPVSSSPAEFEKTIGAKRSRSLLDEEQPLKKKAKLKPTPPKELDDDPLLNKKKMEKLAKTNPHFFNMLAEQNLVAGSGSFDQDDADIALYAKKLGIKKKDKIPSAFTEDGLDFLIEGLLGGGADADEDEVDELASDNADEDTMTHEMAAQSSDNGEIEDGDSSDDAGELQYSDASNDEDELVSDELEYFSDSSMSTDYEDNDVTDGRESGDSDDHEFTDGGESGDSDDHEVTNGGESSDSDAESIVNDPPEAMNGGQQQSDSVYKSDDTAGKYVPPHLRKGPTNHGEQYLRLKRLIQGLLNRLGDANMESIFASIEKCFRENSRHDVNEILTDSIIAFVGDHANLLDSFVMTYAAFIASLYNVIGIEFAAHMVQTMTELIEQSRSQYLNAKANKIEGTVEINSKRCTNLVTLLAYLYNFGVISSILLFDVVRVTIDELSELDIELLLRILRISGFQIRADDPSALKDIVALVQEEVGKRDPASLSSRFKFMVETMMDLKNNKRKLQKKVVTGTDMTQQERLKKFVTNMAKKRNTFEREPLRVGLEDIRSIKTKGKWWLVGAAWAGHDGAGSNLPAGVDSKALTDETGQASSDLLKLARAQKMNTDVRRSIFIVLMSSEDCIDAFERLLKLNLKDKQEREIVRVLIHCCYQERVYNPYYSLVAQKICDHSHGFKITFQYALWDAFKAMVENAQEDEGDAMDVRKVSNLAKLYAHLIGAGSLTLAVLKALTFTSLSPLQALFLKLLLSSLFSTYLQDGDLVRKAVKRVIQQENVREGLALFLRRWAKEGYEVGGKKSDPEIPYRFKIARDILMGM